MTRSEGNRLWTKGPWTFGVRADGSIWQSRGDPESGPHYQDDFFGTVADANLIAAAPRLYETLDVLLNCLDREAVARLGIEQEVLAAVCALQQARGETND